MCIPTISILTWISYSLSFIQQDLTWLYIQVVNWHRFASDRENNSIRWNSADLQIARSSQYRQRAVQPRKRSSIPGRNKKFFFCPAHPHQLWGSQCLLPLQWKPGWLSKGEERRGTELPSHLYQVVLKMRGAMSQFPHTPLSLPKLGGVSESLFFSEHLMMGKSTTQRATNIASRILNFGSRRKWAVSFTPRPLYP